MLHNIIPLYHFRSVQFSASTYGIDIHFKDLNQIIQRYSQYDGSYSLYARLCDEAAQSTVKKRASTVHS